MLYPCEGKPSHSVVEQWKPLVFSINTQFGTKGIHKNFTGRPRQLLKTSGNLTMTFTLSPLKQICLKVKKVLQNIKKFAYFYVVRTDQILIIQGNRTYVIVRLNLRNPTKACVSEVENIRPL